MTRTEKGKGEDYVKAGNRGQLLTTAPQTLTPVSLPSVCILAAGLLGGHESDSGSITPGGEIYIAMVISNRIDKKWSTVFMVYVHTYFNELVN